MKCSPSQPPLRPFDTSIQLSTTVVPSSSGGRLRTAAALTAISSPWQPAFLPPPCRGNGCSMEGLMESSLLCLFHPNPSFAWALRSYMHWTKRLLAFRFTKRKRGRRKLNPNEQKHFFSALKLYFHGYSFLSWTDKQEAEWVQESEIQCNVFCLISGVQ